MTDTIDSGADEFFSEDRTHGRDGVVEQLAGDFRQFVVDAADPVVAQYRGMGWEEYSAERTSPSFVQDLLASWQRLYDEPFRGVTTDGDVRAGLYPLPASGRSDPALREAAEHALALLDPEERQRYCYEIDAPEWRAWSNPEFVIHRVGLRLEDLSEEKAGAILEVIRACLSPEGYAQVREVMGLNGLLGELVDLPTIMNDRSYWVALFGTPSDEAPWGWQIFGHHVALNFVAVRGRHVVAPAFLGAEPAVLENGGSGPFGAREGAALELAASLTPAQREVAVVYDSVLDPAMPADRVHPADERHVAGAFRDNRVVPYEGIRASALDVPQRALLRRILEAFLVLLTEEQRARMLDDIDALGDDLHIAWYGATDGSQPFYLRLHGPVLLAELDHHAGVWLTNRLPARFHVHTTLRLPNGNDYGRVYLDQWRAGQ